jgi:glutamine amidotransferase
MGIFDVAVKRFADVPQMKVPQMGWNNLYNTKSPLFNGFSHDEYVYFVHSYYAEMSEHTIATTDYIVPFSAALHRDNFYAAQFHPEKSGTVGAKIIENFLSL